MQLKNIFTDEDAVSPVIGVILMVAITVILAAVIGAFVLGIGGSQEAAPNASFSFDESATDDTTQDCDLDGTATGTDVFVSHDGGDTITASQLELKSGSNSVAWGSGGCGAGDASAGTQVEVDWSGSSDLNVVWSSSESDKTSVLGTKEA